MLATSLISCQLESIMKDWLFVLSLYRSRGPMFVGVSQMWGLAGVESLAEIMLAKHKQRLCLRTELGKLTS